jgi:hypothetical protein
VSENGVYHKKKPSWEIYDKPSKSAVPYVHTNPPGGDVEALD